MEQEIEIYGSVYMLLNLKNQKKYIGQTKDPEKRRKEHMRGNDKYRNQRSSLISEAIKKHKKENFEFSILRDCYSAEELDYWEIFYIKEYNSLVENGTGYNILRGKIGQTEFPESMKVDRSNKAQKVNKKRKGNFIGIAQKLTGFSMRIRINGKKKSLDFKDEIEAAEFYDCIALSYHGQDARLNFPEKREEYLSKDLKSIYENFVNRKSRYLPFKWIHRGWKGRWQVRTNASKNKPKDLFLGAFESDVEAAKMADKLLFTYENIPVEQLNFPELAKEYKKEELLSFFQKCFCILKPKLNSQKTMGTTKIGKLWRPYITYNKTSLFFTHGHETQEIAHKALVKYLNELLKEHPNITSVQDLNLTDLGVNFIENKSSLEKDFIFKAQKLYEYIIS